MSLREQVLGWIKKQGPVTVDQLQVLSEAEDKPIRSAIDQLRASGEPIWLDIKRGFWWRDDVPPSAEKFGRWERPFEVSVRSGQLKRQSTLITSPAIRSVQNLSKSKSLLALARKRQTQRLPGHRSISDYHRGAYECDFVSPWTKSASASDADLMIVAQDWASDKYLAGPFRACLVEHGHDPHLPTNINLIDLLLRHFGLRFDQVYATNLFPFVKPGAMNFRIPARDLLFCATEFLLPQVDIVRPKLVICLGVRTFNAISNATGRASVPNVAAMVGSGFRIGSSLVAGVAHPGSLGMNARGRSQVDADWKALR